MVAHTALAILNYIMHGAGIFIAYMSGELKGKRDNIASVEKDLWHQMNLVIYLKKAPSH